MAEYVLSRRAVLGAGCSLALAAGAHAQGTAYPDRTVRYIVPFPPGGLTDIAARHVAKHMGETWGQPVIVENRAGGNAMIGAEAAARSAPDGYTLLAVTLTHAVNVTLLPSAPVDMLDDFAVVSILGSLPLVVCVPANSPAKSLAELAALAARRELNGGSSGTGTPPHLGLELFRRASGAGAKLAHVPYRGGAPSITDLVGGRLDLIVSNLPECLPQLQAGRLRGLAVTGEARHPLLPDVPTVEEAGMPALRITNWTGVVTNKAVPEPVRAKIEAAATASMRDPAIRRNMVEGGFDVAGWDAARSSRFFGEEVQRWARLVNEAGIRPD